MSPVEKLNNHTAVSEVETGYYEKVCFQERGGSAQRKFTGSNSEAGQSDSAVILQYAGFGVYRLVCAFLPKLFYSWFYI